MRFSLRWLFGLVAFVSIACFSLVYASPAVSKALFAALVAFLAVSLLGTIYSGRNHRPFWGGCAIIGCLYVASSYLPLRSTNPSYVASTILSDIHKNTARKITTPYTKPGSFQWSPPPGEFIEAGQTIIAFTAAFAGGFVASWFDARGKRSRET